MVINQVLNDLKQKHYLEHLGELFIYQGDITKGLNSLIKGNCYEKAIWIAKQQQPDIVSKIIEKSIEYYKHEGLLEEAINKCLEINKIDQAILLLTLTKNFSMLENMVQKNDKQNRS